MKNTKQRQAILCLLAQSHGPLTAEDIFQSLRDSCPSLALSTVYRNLERFCAEGLVKKESPNDGIIRYTSGREHGHYLVCTECDRRIRLDSCPLSEIEQELARKTGFEIDGHSLTIYGKCPDCLHRGTSGHPSRKD